MTNRFVTVCLLMIISNCVSAQSDTLIHGGVDSLKSVLSPADSLRSSAVQMIDSVESLNNKYSGKISDMPGSLTSAVTDTVRDWVGQWKKDSTITRIKAANPLDRIPGSISSTEGVDTLEMPDAIRKTDHLRDGIESKQSQAHAVISKPVEAVNSKLGQLSSEANGQGTLPGAIEAPSTSLEIPGTTSLTTEKLPELTTPDIGGKIPDDIGQNSGAALSEKVSDAVDLKGMEGSLPASEKVTDATTTARDIAATDLTNAESLSSEAFPQNSQLAAAADELGNANAQLESLKKSEMRKDYKKQTLLQAQEVIGKAMELHQNKINETVSKISKYQKRTGTIFAKAKALPKRPRKSPKPPVIERIVPSLNLQVQKNSLWFVDVNPSIKYRLRSIFSVGTGWNQRVIFDKHFSFYQQHKLYGLRSYAELSILKGLLVRADVERYSAFVPVSAVQPDQGSRQTVWNYMLGIKKEFSFFPGVNGNVQFMYNVYDPDQAKLYFNKFNVRFGFDFLIRKKTSKKQSGSS